MKDAPMLPIPDRRAIAGAAIILWIAVSPWIWGFADAHPAVANHVALVFGFGPLALLIANLRAAAIVTLLGGIWLVASPWALGYAGDHLAWLNEIVTGIALIVLCAEAAELSKVRGLRRRRRAEPSSRPVIADTAGRRP
jgi:SPW repeat